MAIAREGGLTIAQDEASCIVFGMPKEAIALGADAVSIHINLGAPNESRMLEAAGQVSKDCTRWGMPLLIMAYARGTGIDGSSPDAVSHCVRAAEELRLRPSDLFQTVSICLCCNSLDIAECRACTHLDDQLARNILQPLFDGTL